MADVKWIKITTDIFDDEKILLIESLPDSYAIITVWFKLLCLAGKQNNSGVFMMGRIAYTDKMLATIFRMKETTVTMALQTFERFGMIEIVDGVITIPNWGKHQNLDQLESKKEYMRNYMKDYREKQKLLTMQGDADGDADIPWATWQDIKAFFGNKCAYCGKSVKLEKEHVIPFSKGGTFSVGNIVPACRKCNASKGTEDFEEWYMNSGVYDPDRHERIKEYLSDGHRKCLQKPLRKATVNHLDKDIDKDIEEERDKKERVDYDGIVDAYNTLCPSLPSVKSLSNARKKAIRARLNIFTIDDIHEAFRKAEASDFLKGKNDRNWQANFDWIIKDANIAKILDGNYDNKTQRRTVNTGIPAGNDMTDLDALF